MTLPTAETITNLYLYGQEYPPENRLDPYAVNDAERESVSVNLTEYMTEGSGRFVSASSFGFVRDFFNKTSIASFFLQPGTYTKSALFEVLGIANDVNYVTFNNLFYGVDDADYAERTYIWGTVGFAISDDAVFVVSEDGSRTIEEFSIVPLQLVLPDRAENFDFIGGTVSQYGNDFLGLYETVDPYRIGKKVVFDIQGEENGVSLNYEDFTNSFDGISVPSFPAPGKIWELTDRLFANGSTRYLHEGKPVIYGKNTDDSFNGTVIIRDGLNYNLADHRHLGAYVGNGVVYVSAAGNDTIIATDHDDTLIAGAGSDTLTGGMGDDYLDGGTGDDTYLFDSGEAFGRDVIVDPASDGNDQLLLDDAVIRNLVAVEKNGNLFRFLDEDGNPVSGKENWVFFRNGSDASLIMPMADGVLRSIHLQGFDKASNAFGIELDEQPHSPDSVLMQNVFIVGDGQSGGNGQPADGYHLSELRIETPAYGGGTYLTSSMVYDAATYWQPAIDAHLALYPDDQAVYWYCYRFEGSMQADVMHGNTWPRAGEAPADFLQGNYYLLDTGDGPVLLADVLWGLDGDDVLTGDGSTTNKTAGDDDVLSGGRGDDRLYGGGGNDVVFAAEVTFFPSVIESLGMPLPGLLPTVGVGNLGELTSSSGRDAFREAVFNGQLSLETRDEENLLDGGDGNDALAGASYNDVLIGGKGEDYIVGGAGQDVIAGGADADFIYGDSYVYTGHFDEPFQFAADYIAPDLAPKNLAENFRYYYWQKTPADARFDKATDYNDTIDGGDGQDFIMGEIGADQIYGGEGDDFIDGDRVNDFDGLFIQTDKTRVFQKLSLAYHGNDYLDGGIGNDFLRGNGGNDWLEGGVGDDVLYGDDPYLTLSEGGTDQLYGGAGNDLVLGNGGSDSLYGDDGNDTLWGDARQTDGSGSAPEGAGDDDLHGGAGNDNLFGDDGNDKLAGGNGDDVLVGGAGHDTLTGGKGYDELKGGAGDDVYVFNGGDGDISCHVHGDSIVDNAGKLIIRIGGNQSPGAGLFFHYSGIGNGVLQYSSNASDSIYLPADTLGCLTAVITAAGSYSLADLTNARGTAGNDTLDGMAWNDVIALGTGDDSMSGKSGDDVLYAGEGADVLWGNDGSDTLYGDGGDDYLYGDQDGDSLYGGDGSDQLAGGDGDDQLVGETGNDTLFGNDGQDTLRGSDGFDRLQGGAGDDVYVFAAGDGGSGGIDNYGDLISDNDGSLVVQFVGVESLAALSVQTFANDSALLRYSTSPEDTVLLNTGTWRNAQALRLDDVLVSIGDLLSASATAAADALRGTAGDDVFSGREGNDYLYGRLGNDDLSGDEGADELFGESGADVLWGGSGNDSLHGGYDNDALHGGDGNDGMYGESGDDWLFANAGNDYVTGDDGDDWLLGGLDDDDLHGGNGQDALGGEEGNDQLDGGAGNDTYYYTRGWGNDTITDVDTTGVDVVRLFNLVPEEIGFRIAGNRTDLLVTLGDDNTLTIEDYWTRAGTVEAFTVVSAEGIVLSEWSTPAQLLSAAFTGSAGNDVLVGTSVADSLHGHAGNDTLVGHEGDDRLDAGEGDDTIDGGAGNDIYIDAAGNDNYTGALGDGDDVLRYRSGQDVMQVNGADVIDLSLWAFSAVQCQRVLSGRDVGGSDVFDDLLISIRGEAGHSLLLKNYCTAGTAVTLQFSDTVFNQAAMLSWLAIPTAGDDVLIGDANANTLAGGAGDDVLMGGEGADTYVFQRGDGEDVLIDPTAGTDSLQLQGLLQTDVRLSHVTAVTGQEDLVIDVLDTGLGDDGLPTGDRITIQHYFRNSDAGMALQFMPDKGKTVTLSWAAVVDLVRNDYIAGSSDRRVVDKLDGKGGNDVLVGLEGSDTLSGGTGEDYLVGGTTYPDENHYHSDTTPNWDTYLYNKGDGNDRILNANTQITGLPAGELRISGYTAAEATFVREGSALVIQFAQETITLEQWFLTSGPYARTRDPVTGVTQSLMQTDGYLSHQLDAVYFGRTAVARDTINAAFTLTEGNDAVGGGYGKTFEDRRADVYHGLGGDDKFATGLLNDVIYGDAGNDKLDGGEDNDFLSGGTGNDTYVSDGLLRGDRDVIANADALVTDMDVLTLTGESLDYRSLWFAEGGDGNDLVISALGSTGSVIVQDWFGSQPQAKLDTVQVAPYGGEVMALATAGVDALVQAMATFSAANGVPSSVTQDVKDLHDTSLQWLTATA